jgi:branched-chain amino acid aminotransferase
LNPLINFQGDLIDPKIPVATAFNRSLRYGDGIFETMYWDGQQVRNLPFHLDRLFHGLVVLEFDLTAGFTREFISGEIFRLCRNNAPDCKARIRLNVFREDGRTLMPENNKPVFVIESTPLNEKDQSPLRLTIFEKEKKSTGILSNLKTNNYLLNILAVQHAREIHFDDALILNSKGNICEASSSNVFFVRNGTLLTPALTEGCVAGTKRRQLMEVLPRIGFRVEEEVITPEMVAEMEEVFLTNAIRGIIPVTRINELELSLAVTNRLVQLLSSSII